MSVVLWENLISRRRSRRNPAGAGLSPSSLHNTSYIYVLNMGKIQLVISDLKVAMLYFEQLLVAKVIYDVINHKIILDDVCKL